MSPRQSPELSARQLDAIIARRSPEMAKLTKAVLAKLRPRLPGAVEMVYDKKNALVIGFCPDERASNVINSIAVYTKWINLYFFEGDTLPGSRRPAARQRERWSGISGDERRRSGPAGGEGVDGRGAEARRSAAGDEGETANRAQAGQSSLTHGKHRPR